MVVWQELCAHDDGTLAKALGVNKGCRYFGAGIISNAL